LFSAYTLVGENTNKGSNLSSPHGYSPSSIAIIRLISGEDVAALRCRRMRMSRRKRMR
jgi:hypothetical protein